MGVVCGHSNLNHLMNLLDIGFEIPNEFVVGYALDYNEFFRDLNVSTLPTGLK